jgi:hypothetical protein
MDYINPKLMQQVVNRLAMFAKYCSFDNALSCKNDVNIFIKDSKFLNRFTDLGRSYHPNNKWEQGFKFSEN